MNKVLITAPYMIREKKKVEDLFKGKNVKLDWAEVKERLEEPEMLRIIEKYNGIICGDDRITKKVIEQAINLEVIVKWGTGIDSIDKEEAERQGIRVFRTPDAFSEPVGDTTLGVILAFARSVFTSDRLMKRGGWDKPQGYCLSEKTIGIIGLGSTGTAVAKRLSIFGSIILANDIVEKDPEIISRYGIKMVSKDEIYEKADFICIHCDLNKTSFHLLNEEAFKKMKKKPYIINMARGPIIDEAALINALESGKIAGAGLDVFEDEPLSKGSPLRKMDNVILSSHNANSSPYYWHKVHENSVRMLLEGLGIE
jgi:D-3-phosphoglycerate dehydrogenase / 2-oxoglutarate reductase